MLAISLIVPTLPRGNTALDAPRPLEGLRVTALVATRSVTG